MKGVIRMRDISVEAKTRTVRNLAEHEEGMEDIGWEKMGVCFMDESDVSGESWDVMGLEPSVKVSWRLLLCQ